MSQSKDRFPLASSLGSLGWPLVYGSFLCCLFYLLILRGPLGTDFTQRYFINHPILVATTAMFCVGLAALGMKLLNLVRQQLWLPRISLGPIPPDGQEPSDSGRLLESLARYPQSARRSYLGQRLEQALAFVRRQNSAEQLGEELKYLADLDVGRQQDSYALVRIIIWATPMLGFLGTVIGITQALGDLSPKEMADSVETAMQGLLAGLYVAFDTTALALTLSILLMFLQFAVDRFETQLLSAVDFRAEHELLSRFVQVGTASDPNLAAVQRMCQAVVKTTEQLVHRQSQIWQSAIEAAHEQWQQIVPTTGKQLQTALSEAIDGSLNKFADRMGEFEETAAQQALARQQQWQTTLSEHARLLRDQQSELARQGELLHKVITATGEVTQLEKALNDNLQLLAGAKNFEDTVMSLSAAIHLLTSRLGQDHQRVELHSTKAQGRAA